MGLRSTFIKIDSPAKLSGVFLMQAALSDWADYETYAAIHYFCVWRGDLYCAFSHDGSTAFDFYDFVKLDFMCLDECAFLKLTDENSLLKGCKIVKPSKLETYF